MQGGDKYSKSLTIYARLKFRFAYENKNILRLNLDVLTQTASLKSI